MLNSSGSVYRYSALVCWIFVVSFFPFHLCAKDLSAPEQTQSEICVSVYLQAVKNNFKLFNMCKTNTNAYAAQLNNFASFVIFFFFSFFSCSTIIFFFRFIFYFCCLFCYFSLAFPSFCRYFILSLPMEVVWVFLLLLLFFFSHFLLLLLPLIENITRLPWSFVDL